MDIYNAFQWGFSYISFYWPGYSRSFRRPCFVSLSTLPSFVNVGTEPLQASLPQLMIGHDNGLSSGDMECAARCATMYINNAFQSGLNLQTLFGQMNTFASEMRQYKQFMPLRLLTLYIQSVFNLINVDTNDPVLLTGEAMNEQSFLKEVTSKGMKMLLCQFHFRKMKHAYLFRRHDVAAEAIIKGREIKSASCSCPNLRGVRMSTSKDSPPSPSQPVRMMTPMEIGGASFPMKPLRKWSHGQRNLLGIVGTNLSI